MVPRDRARDTMVALMLLGGLLLLPPVLLLFNRPTLVLGVPLLYLYLFAAWVLLIALAAAMVRRIAPGETGQPGQPAQPPDAGLSDA